MVQYTLAFSAILLLCISSGDATSQDKIIWNGEFAELDRSSSVKTNGGYYAKSIDTTTFIVNKNTTLVKAVLPELFLINKQGKTVSFDAPIEAVVEIISPTESCMWQKNVKITPNGETEIDIQPKIDLEAGNTYKIIVKLPEQHIYAFNGKYSRKQFHVESELGVTKVQVDFVEPSQDQDVDNVFSRSPSVGIVKKIQLQRWFPNVRVVWNI